MKTIKNYGEAVEFIESLSNIGLPQKDKSIKEVKERLENVKRFLKFLGNPEKKLKVIHIAGTSGKGSVCNMLHDIFYADGKKVGSYTSPHTTTFCERIKIGDKYISEKELVDVTNFLKDKLDAYTLCPTPYTLSLNFFEFSFCLAVYYFAKQKCEYAVIETGCGGRHDASNAIKKSIYTIITNIGPDHLNIFGSLENLAYEKAGIIKPNVPILTGETDNKWLNIFRKEIKGNYKLQITNYKLLRNIKINLDGTSFEYNDKEYNLKFIGEHQARNAILAIECAKELLGTRYPIVKKGLARAFYSARMEVISKKPVIILDGGHNSDKIKACVSFIRNKESGIRNQGKKFLILGMAKNKDIKNIPRLLNFFDEIYFTRFSNPFRKAVDFKEFLYTPARQKFLQSENLGGVAKNKKAIYHYKHCAQDALSEVLTKIKDNDLLVITGSIFLAGELRAKWCNEKKILKQRNSKI